MLWRYPLANHIEACRQLYPPASSRHDRKLVDDPVDNNALGYLLMDFLDFYGNHFPYDTSYISPTEGKILLKTDKGWVNLPTFVG